MTQDKNRIEEAYGQRETSIQRLAEATSISVKDLVSLDALGRYTVACDLWNKCSKAARVALLNDEHIHVRNAATRMQRK